MVVDDGADVELGGPVFDDEDVWVGVVEVVVVSGLEAVSYTHLTLPTILLV